MKKSEIAATEQLVNAISELNNKLDKIADEVEDNIIDKVSKIPLINAFSADDIAKALNLSNDPDEDGCDDYDECEDCPICNESACALYKECNGLLKDDGDEDEDESWDLSLRDIFALSMASNKFAEDTDDPIIDSFLADVFNMMKKEGYVVMKEV